MDMREELDLEKTGNVTGGSYVTSSMTLSEIVSTDRRLAGVLADAGVPVIGNKSLLGASLYEVAEIKGLNADALVNRMNEYLDG